MQYYLPLKSLHITLVILSVFLFNLRYALRLRFPHRALRLLWRRIPHVIDTFLLITGIGLAAITRTVPFFPAQWLGVKLVLLVFYILFGVYALRTPARSKENIFVYVMAMLCIFLMILIALYKPAFWH